jgi:hypothetical protein
MAAGESSGLSPAQERARAAEWMAFERANRPASPKELQKARQAEADERAQAATLAASDWLLARAPGLQTPGGLACGIAIGALKGLRVQRPELVGDALLAAVLAYRNGKVRAWDAEDLVVDVGGRATS